MYMLICIYMFMVSRFCVSVFCSVTFLNDGES